MAGNYPDVPGHRMAWDLDGSALFFISTAGAITERSEADRRALNDENPNMKHASGNGPFGEGARGEVCVIFPEPRDLAGYFISHIEDGIEWVKTSVDTTTGLDGTWVTQTGSPTERYQYVVPVYRTLITPLAVSAIKAIKTSNYYAGTGGGNINLFHLYGTRTSASDRLAIWNPSSDAPVGPAYFDWGNAPRLSTADKTFRIKNLSSTLTANTITVSTDTLTDTTPTNVSQHTLSNGGAFASTTDGGNLAPGAISGVLTLRRTTDVAATLSLWALRLKAIAASWS